MSTRPKDLTPAVTLIQKWEGIRDGDPTTVNLDPYLDPVGIWTIGWGHVVRDAAGRIFTGASQKAAARAIYPKGITRTEAETLLATDVLGTASAIENAVRAPLNAHQFCALTSWTFNIGAEAMRTSTLAKRVNARDYQGAAAELPKWKYATDRATGKKVILAGLVNRRREERALFERPVAAGVGVDLMLAIEAAQARRALALLDEARAILGALAA